MRSRTCTSRSSSLIAAVRWVLILFLVGAASLLALHVPAFAQGGYPERKATYLHDLADVVPLSEGTEIRILLATLRQEGGPEVVAVTIERIEDYDTGDETVESFATNLFNTWGVGTAEQDDGALILVAVGENKARIELGAGYGGRLDAEAQRIMEREMLPQFREGAYGAGILQGAQALAEALAKPLPTPTTAPAVRPAAETAGQSTTEVPAICLGSMGIPLAVGALLFGGHLFRRYHKRHCPNCGATMVRLEAGKDKAYLEKGQLAERRVGSVAHDVWVCDDCDEQLVCSYQNWLTPWKTCPQCQYRTRRVRSETVVEPTYSKEGKKKITDSCTNCSYERVAFRTLSRKRQNYGYYGSGYSGSSDRSSSTSSRSSSSSSSGGGRSSGDGASGEW